MEELFETVSEPITVYRLTTCYVGLSHDLMLPGGGGIT